MYTSIGIVIVVLLIGTIGIVIVVLLTVALGIPDSSSTSRYTVHCCSAIGIVIVVLLR